MFLGKEVRVFLKGDAKKAYLNLKKRKDGEAQGILNSFERIKSVLQQNPQFGNPLHKQLIPKEIKKQGITNLYGVELSNYWRMIYTLEGNQLNILIFVLKIFDHKEYNKFFKYK